MRSAGLARQGGLSVELLVLPLRLFKRVVVMVAMALVFGFVAFATDIPRGPAKQPEEITRTEAIVVLTGGRGRVAAGARLLLAGRSDRLFVSGVGAGTDLDDLLTQAPAFPAELRQRVVLGHAAADTLGNAAETAEWVRREGIKSITLVTANYHLARSLLEVQRAMPGVRIEPYPVISATVKVDGWWEWPGTALLLLEEYGKLVTALFRGLLAQAFASRTA